MAHQRQLVIADQRAVTPRLRWLTLYAPDLARAAQAGQYLLVRCAEQGSYDPLLRRPLFIAATELLVGQPALAGAEVDKETRRQGNRSKPKREPASQSPSLPVSSSPIAWADQVFAALPHEQLLVLRESIVRVKYRWERGFAG